MKKVKLETQVFHLGNHDVLKESARKTITLLQINISWKRVFPHLAVSNVIVPMCPQPEKVNIESIFLL